MRKGIGYGQQKPVRRRHGGGKTAGGEPEPMPVSRTPEGAFREQALEAAIADRQLVLERLADMAVEMYATACVISDEWNGPWVQVDGTAEVLDLPDALEPLVDYYRTIAGEHPDWDEYRSAMERQGKSLIRLTPQRWGPVATGGFPARLA